MVRTLCRTLGSLFVLTLTAGVCVAQEAPGESLSAGQAEPALVGADVAWMLTSSALVLMMTAPGLALFYGGLVPKKNILSVIREFRRFCNESLGTVTAWGQSAVLPAQFGPDNVDSHIVSILTGTSR